MLPAMPPQICSFDMPAHLQAQYTIVIDKDNEPTYIVNSLSTTLVATPQEQRCSKYGNLKELITVYFE